MDLKECYGLRYFLIDPLLEKIENELIEDI